MTVGDTIAYTAKFVRYAGGYSKEVADRRGTILSLRDEKFARVRWADGAEGLVHLNNVAKVGSLRFGDPHA